MRLGTFFLKVHYFFEKRKEDRKFYAEIFRTCTMHFINTQLAKADRIKDPKNLIKFSWEEENNIEIDENKAMDNVGRMIAILNNVGKDGTT